MKKTLYVLIAFICSCAFFATGASKTPAVDIETKTDSLLVLADDYAEALAAKPEFARTRLNILKKYYAAIPEGAVRDSVRSRLFDFYVSYVEADNAPRAEAFKDCFMAIASDTDEHLGPIYLTELNAAREDMDTTALKNHMARLQDYADRMQYDYDEELAAARAYLRDMRGRLPLREALRGVWVSTDLIDNPALFTNAGLGSVAAAVWAGSLKNHDLSFHTNVMSMNILSFAWDGTRVRLRARFDNKTFYTPAQQSELADLGLVVDESRVNPKSKEGRDGWMVTPVEMELNEPSQWLYAFWHTEDPSTFDPEIPAMLRQSVQNMQAKVAGHYSRSRYSFGDRLAANALAEGFSAVTNGIISYFAVSKDVISTKELNVQLQHPRMLVGRADVVQVESRSDHSIPTVRDRHVEMKFYRWQPDDNVFFISSAEMPMGLFEPSKTENAHQKEIVKAAKKYWKEHRDKKNKDDKFFRWFNTHMLSVLRQKASDGPGPSAEIAALLQLK